MVRFFINTTITPYTDFIVMDNTIPYTISYRIFDVLQLK